jgi:hypothetical protein
MALALVSAVPASASPQPQHSARSPHGFWFVITPGESFADAVQQTARVSGGQVMATIGEMLKQARSGQAIYIPQGTRRTVISVRATVPELRALLSEVRSLDIRPAAVTGTHVSSRTAPDYSVRGAGCNPVIRNHFTVDATWCDLPLELDGGTCDPECHTVDRLKARVTTNPGATVSTAPYTLTNVVSTGYPTVFAAASINWTTLCYRGKDPCDSGGTGNISLNSSGTMRPTSNVGLWGDTITHQYVLKALFIPNGLKYSDGALTGSALCESKSEGNQCFYPT